MRRCAPSWTRWAAPASTSPAARCAWWPRSTTSAATGQRRRAPAPTPVLPALALARGTQNEADSMALLGAHGLPCVPCRAALDADAAVAAAEALGYPVALKVLSRDIPHKSDIGG